MQPDSTAAFYTGVKDPAVEALFDRLLPQMRADIEARRIAKLAGVWLGGGYGRGEGGVRRLADGRKAPYNDIDFFVFTNGASEAEKADCARQLAAVAAKYAAEFGVDVDFCRPRNPADFKKDEDRLMIQELKRGHVAILGGGGLLDHVKAVEPGELPRMEALRLLMNRGMGLILAAGKVADLVAQEDVDFFLRNLNKAVLGAGDARLIADGAYAWRIVDRAEKLRDPRYDAAVSFKFNPTAAAPEDPEAAWRAARDYWLKGAAEIGLDGTRTLRQAVRWVVRRRSFGPVASFGQDCTVRVLRRIREILARRMREVALPASLERDWKRFN